MAYEAITTAEVASGKPVVGPGGFGLKTKYNFDYLYGMLGVQGGGGISNGSFEVDADASGVPDLWTKNLYAGGVGAFYTTAPAHGVKAWSFTHPGGVSNGGGYLDSDYVEVSEYFTYYLFYTLFSTATGMRNKVQIRYFDASKVELVAGSPVDIYNSVVNPTAWTVFYGQFTPPATTKYIKVRLIGGYTDTDVAGTTYFDNIILTSAISALQAEGSAPTERNTTSSTYVKLKEISAKSNKITVSFWLWTSAATSEGRIYVNGVAVGIERSTASLIGESFTENFEVSPTDLIQLYVKRSLTATAYVSSFYITPTITTFLNDNVITD